MTDPADFPSTTPRWGLPLLFAGQAQKEFFVNAALSRFDALAHPAIDGEVLAPPADPAEDGCWLVAANGGDAFAGREGQLAFRQAGAWAFVEPREGLRVFDKSAGQYLLFAGVWRREAGVAEPVGGQTVDVEARAAISELIAALSRSGIFAGD
ncbi:DUF2793 domain-containing protein [Tsuneonella sp. SYSU-LHT278]|uniref:DUF2793 domain-containing protein n=1 Tax=Tsuneonella sediminis TaxID=3416089 RepID=UPI003F799418